MTDLTDRRILVIGATGVLGGLVAERLAAAGARLALSGRNQSRLGELDAHGTTVVGDLTDDDGAEAIVDAALAALDGEIDGLVVAAGVVAFDGVGESKDGDLETLFTVNALGPIRAVSAALPALSRSAEAKREPFVLTLSGIVSDLPTAGMASYSASKAAIAAYISAAGRELRRSGIRLVDARPGHIETGLAERPLFGAAPHLATGLEPAAVADRLVAAIRNGETSLPPDAFTAGTTPTAAAAKAATPEPEAPAAQPEN